MFVALGHCEQWARQRAEIKNNDNQNAKTRTKVTDFRIGIQAQIVIESVVIAGVGPFHVVRFDELVLSFVPSHRNSSDNFERIESNGKPIGTVNSVRGPAII